MPPISSPSSGSLKTFLQKTLYAFVFCLLIPFFLLAAAYILEPYMQLTAPQSTWGGLCLAGLGFVIMISGMISLRISGGGLPMNGFPPPTFVSTGIYRLIPHPIYIGFILFCAGGFLILGLSAGLFLITPLVALGCLSIIWGYEKHDLEARFGKSTPRNLFSLPDNTEGKASWFDRIRIYILLYGLWAVLYSLGPITGITDGAPSCRIMGEENIPIVEVMGWWYVSIYPVAAIFSLSLISRKALRIFVKTAALPILIGFILYLFIPLTGEPLPFTPTTIGGTLLEIDRNLDLNNSIAFPSYHVLWGLIFVTVAIKLRTPFSLLIPLIIWCAGMIISCVLCGMHGWIDLIAAIVIVIFCESMPFLYKALLKAANLVANSWKQYRLGSFRIINHSAYAFIAACGGFYLILTLAGEHETLSLLLIMICSLAGSALWAQLIEGSPVLLRPFGYYGAIFGGLIGVILLFILNPWLSLGDLPSSPWVVFAAFATASPWIQAIGRIRCLVQGCCHGRPVREGIPGISHTNPSSRVCALTSYKGVPLHPTPLYSIIINLLIGIFLLRLWISQLPAGMLIGLYFILAGLSRFVEEAYRGEPQTKSYYKLTEYQWFSILLVLFGFLVWLIPSSMISVPMASLPKSWGWISLIVGLLYAFCMGMDFPNSRKKLSRLTG